MCFKLTLLHFQCFTVKLSPVLGPHYYKNLTSIMRLHAKTATIKTVTQIQMSCMECQVYRVHKSTPETGTVKVTAESISLRLSLFLYYIFIDLYIYMYICKTYTVLSLLYYSMQNEYYTCSAWLIEVQAMIKTDQEKICCYSCIEMHEE